MISQVLDDEIVFIDCILRLCAFINIVIFLIPITTVTIDISVKFANYLCYFIFNILFGNDSVPILLKVLVI